MAQFLTDTQINSVYELYIGYFNRAPEAGGLNYWSNYYLAQANAGKTDAAIQKDIANQFYSAAVQYNIYTAGTPVADFVKTSYLNALGRTSVDDAGMTYWTAKLTSGEVSRGEFVQKLISDAKGFASDATYGWVSKYLDNRMAVAKAFAAANTTTGDAAITAGKAALSAVTPAAVQAGQTTAQALAAAGFGDTSVAGNTFTLTNGTDTATSNVFNAGLVYTPGGNDRINALQDEDVLTGTGTNPTLNATLGVNNDNGGTTITPTLKGIETLNISFTGSGGVNTLDLQDATGVKAVNVDRITDPTAAVAINNMTAVPANLSLSNTNSPAAGVSFTFTDAGAAGTADATALKLSNVVVGTLTVQENAVLGALDQGVESLTIQSAGSANSVGIYQRNATTGVDTSAGNGLQAQDLRTLTLTGDKALTISNILNADGSLSKVDASAMTAGLDINIASETAAQSGDNSGLNIAMNFVGSAKDDVVRVGAALGATDSIAAGEGNDVLRVYNNATATLINGTITGVETLDVRTNDQALAAGNAVAGATTLTADTSKVGGLQSVVLRNDGNAAAAGLVDFNLTNVSATLASTADAITLRHGTNGNNTLATTQVTVALASATGANDTVALSIVNDTNTDLTSSFRLTAANVENVTLKDSDTESNTVQLNSFANHTGTVTVTNGAAGNHFGLNVDVTTQANFNNFAAASATTAADLANLNDAAAVTLGNLVASKVEASAYAGNVAVVLGQPVSATNVNGAQNVQLGSGNDLVIFNDNGTNAGLTSADTVAAGTGTDTLRVSTTNAAASLGNSEFQNVSGFEKLQVRDTGNYNITLTTGLVSNGADFVVDHVDRGVANGTLTVDARAITTGFKFYGESDYDYTAAYTTTTTRDATWNAVRDTVILGDTTLNNKFVFDGGDANGRIQNVDVIRAVNKTQADFGDLVNIRNSGVLEFASEASVAQDYTVQLNDTFLDAQDSSQAATSAARESYTVRALQNAVAPAADTLLVDAANVTNAFNVVVGGARGANTITLGAGDDTVVLWGGFAAGTYAGNDAAGRALNVESDFNGATAGQGIRAVTESINFGAAAGTDTLVTYGAINLTGATLTNVDIIVANSTLVISAVQFRALTSLRFETNTTHQLRIIGDGGPALDLSKITLASGALVVDTRAFANGVDGAATATTNTVVDNSTTGDFSTGNVATDAANNTSLTSVFSDVAAGATATGTAGTNDVFRVAVASLAPTSPAITTITGTAADYETVRMTDVGTFTVAAAGGAGSNNVTNIDKLELGNGTNSVSFTGTTGVKDILGGTGADSIALTNITTGGAISLGAGNDNLTALTVAIATAAGATFNGGADTDTATFANGETITAGSLAGFSNIESVDFGTVGTISAVTLVNGITTIAANTTTAAITVTGTGAQLSALTSITNTNGTQAFNLTASDAGATFDLVGDTIAGTAPDVDVITFQATGTNTLKIDSTNIAKIAGTVVAAGATDVLELSNSATAADTKFNAFETIQAAAGTTAIDIIDAGVAVARTINGNAGDNIVTLTIPTAAKTVNLSTGGVDTVSLASLGTSQVAVTVQGFTAGSGTGADKIDLFAAANGTTGVTVTTTAGIVTTGATVVSAATNATTAYVLSGSSFQVTGALTQTGDGGAVEAAILNAALRQATVTNGQFILVAVDNGTDTGIYRVTTNTDVGGDANAIDRAGDLGVELLVTLTGVADAGTLVAANII